MDVVDPATRSRMMSGIRGKNTRPELLVRAALSREKYAYRLHRADLPGRPDVVVPRARAAIFAHGCFWHAHRDCALAKLPATRTEFWTSKLSANARRDEDAVALLNLHGWRALIVWECATRAFSPEELSARIAEWLESGRDYGELRGPAPRRAITSASPSGDGDQ